jgi:D-glycero-D-manno-heptose 1,7-bisphosphate phosphatase
MVASLSTKGEFLGYPTLPANGGYKLQAVILAGGRGERLRPLTDETPKCMVDIDGRPFIYHLIMQLQQSGISEILILAGYKADVIDKYFRFSAINNLKILVAKADEKLSKSERLIAASHLIHSKFLLLYSDNYAQFELSQVINHPARNILTISKKKPGNVYLDQTKSKVFEFTPHRRENNSEHVEIGYAKFDRDALFYEIKNTNDLDEAIGNIAKMGDLHSHELTTGYLSISDPERLELTRSAFNNNNIILIDRDGVINVNPGKGQYVKSVSEIRYIPETLHFMSVASAEYCKKFIVISNQAGVARGHMTESQVKLVNKQIEMDLKKKNIEILEFLFCLHGWNEGCYCRKPNPGLLFDASEKHAFILGNTVFIGDDIRDVEAAVRAGTRAILVNEETFLPESSNHLAVAHLSDKIIKNFINKNQD